MSIGLSRLLLIDPDPVFRLGLKVALSEYPDLPMLVEAEQPAAIASLMAIGERVQLIILELVESYASTEVVWGLPLCRSLITQYPQVPILLLTHVSDAAVLEAARQMGVAGYCPKGTTTAELVRVIRQVLGGQTAWPMISSVSTPNSSLRILSGPFNILRENTRRSGLEQIDAAMAELSVQLQGRLSLLDRAVLVGRYRELRAARWLVNQLLASAASPSVPRSSQPPDTSDTSALINSGSIRVGGEPESALLSTAPSPSPIRPMQAALFDGIVMRLQSSLANLTDSPQEIDILREEKKRELLYLALRKVEDGLSELRLSQVQADQLVAKREVFLRDLWQAILTDFLGKYYTLRLDRERQLEVVPTLLADYVTVAPAILNRIPQLPELLAHLLFQTPLMVDNVSCKAGSPEAMEQARQLLENLIIQLANSVMQPLLNHFADVEVIKQGFYDRRLLSTRDIERFRNDLSWKYRLQRYVQEPKAIFESQYRLLVLSEQGIQRQSIYAPRRQELEQLSGVPFAVTLLLEARDAIAPRLRSTISWVGTGVIYVLTDVIGRGLGLIGRGVLQGIGNVWQDTKQR